MRSIESSYFFFNLASDCSTEELKSAYLRMMREHHPDVNPQRVEDATNLAKEITERYRLIKEHRKVDVCVDASKETEAA